MKTENKAVEAATKRVILVVESGWVFVGTPCLSQRGTDDLFYKDVSNIRVWGTTEGLGQLALHGATKETVLDPCGMLRLKEHALLFEIPVVSDL